MSGDQEIWEKWKRWLEIADENFTQMLISRQIWSRFNRMLGEIPNHSVLRVHGGPFVSWVTGMYVHSQSVAVRRQSDKRSDVITLRRILEDMKDDQAVVDKFSKNPATSNELQQEIDQLVALSQKVRTYVDKQIAHLDHENQVQQVTFSDLNQSIDQLGAIMQRCYLLLHCSYMELEPTEATNWVEIFKHPWIPDENDRVDS